jgi:aspartate kinase
VTRAESAQTAVQAIHTAFGLDADGEAVVYAGTGR